MRRFASLDVWKIARSLPFAAYRLTLQSPLHQHFELKNQIRRAAISIPANLAEGYGLGTRPQMIRCARIALGSAYELRTHLQLSKDLELVPVQEGSETLSLCDRATALLIGLLRGLESCTGR